MTQAHQVGAARRARALRVAALVLLSVVLLESVLLTWHGEGSSPIGAPVGVGAQWVFSGVLAVALLAVLGGAYLLRSSVFYYVVIAVRGLGGVLLSAIALLWTGRVLTLLVGLAVFASLLAFPRRWDPSER
jgi:hypothetical protein